MITLVLGGARSGKSDLAEQLATRLPQPVVYVATIVASGTDDEDLNARVAAHRARRPSEWKTVEAIDLVAAVRAEPDSTMLVDSLGPWVAAHLDSGVDVTAFVDALRERAGETIVVSEEVGLGVHPSSEAGRVFRDMLGDLNRMVATVADDVLFVVAGRVLRG